MLFSVNIGWKPQCKLRENENQSQTDKSKPVTPIADVTVFLTIGFLLLKRLSFLSPYDRNTLDIGHEMNVQRVRYVDS